MIGTQVDSTQQSFELQRGESAQCNNKNVDPTYPAPAHSLCVRSTRSFCASYISLLHIHYPPYGSSVPAFTWSGVRIRRNMCMRICDGVRTRAPALPILTQRSRKRTAQFCAPTRVYTHPTLRIRRGPTNVMRTWSAGSCSSLWSRDSTIFLSVKRDPSSAWDSGLCSLALPRAA